MDIRRMVLAAIVICFAGGTPASASFWHPQLPTTRKLLGAPVVLWGEVKSVRPDQPVTWKSRDSDELTSCTALIRFRRIPDGDLFGDSLTVTCTSGRAENDYGQPLVVGRSYVFFLSHPKGSQPFHGIDRYEFALQTENVPFDDLKGLGTEEALRKIAQVNIASANEAIAARWCDFLGGMYRDEDRQVFVDAADTSRSFELTPQPGSGTPTTTDGWHLRGTAIAVLCEHTKMTTATSRLATTFVRRFTSGNSTTDSWEPGWTSPEGLGNLTHRLETVFRENAKVVSPTDAQLREWLSIGGLQYLAMDIIREKRRTELLPDVRELRDRTTNPDSWRFVSETVQFLETPLTLDQRRNAALDEVVRRSHPVPSPSPTPVP